MNVPTFRLNREIIEEAPCAAERGVCDLSSLLENFDEAACASVSPHARQDAVHQNRLALARLGVASALFVALRAKHAATAAHSLRVALTCSAWAFLLELSPDERDVLEVAALLHDIGKIGIPDRVLLKPGELAEEEIRVMQRHRDHARHILGTCCASPDVVEAVIYSGAWFDGRTPDADRRGEQLPRAARVLAIVEAFDAMTTDHVYRRAMSRERAVAELYERAGTQFDPLLIRKFIQFLGSDHERLRASVVSHWLRDLGEGVANRFWQLNAAVPRGPLPDASGVFHEQLLDSLGASVVFVDSRRTILKWSRECETLTGLAASCVEGLPWSPSLIQLRDENYTLIPNEACPVVRTIQQGSAQRLRLIVTNAQGEKVSVDAQVTPVPGADGGILGATLLMFDASSQVNLERQVERLHEKASQDGLTKIANRAEFDRQHEAWVRAHHERELPYSMIICDLDHFKKVNDTYGHQAGDEALVSFAALLRKFCRAEDLVARYGGEEFVVLCPDCDSAATAARAESIRAAWGAKPHPLLNGKCLTSSFGVTELQPGDTAETMLRRADRALLQAKDGGRNAVVQLGSGRHGTDAPPTRRTGWFGWLHRKPTEKLVQRSLITASPLKLTVEKLRGFVADHAAEILAMEDDRLTLRVAGVPPDWARRNTDRPTPYVVELQFQELQVPGGRQEDARGPRTLVHIAIRPQRERDRRRDSSDQRVRQLVGSLKAYLMAQDYVPPEGTGDAWAST